MKGMTEAVALITAELQSGSEILIWGDYDVDGTTGTALLVNFFRQLGSEVHWHIPDRLTDGYGLNVDTFRNIYEHNLGGKPFLLITVDCGISNSPEIEAITAMGGRAVVTDHHLLPRDSLPRCIILNPNQSDCGFGDHKLSGVGVAFYLAAAIRKALTVEGFFRGVPPPNMKDFLGFVALGTVADLVDLTPVNRILVRGGMESLANPEIPGIQALMSSANLVGSPLTTEDISFCLAPRINAAGRLGKAETAVSLMTCDNIVHGMALAKELENFNITRKSLCDTSLVSALSILDNSSLKGNYSLVLSGDFHVGIIGIVAAKLVELFAKPAIVFAITRSSNGTALLKGSGRSTAGIDLLQCLHDCADVLEKYGGHAMAAGLTIKAEALEMFCSQFDRAVAMQAKSLLSGRHSSASAFECTLDEVMDKTTLEFLQLFEPFGPGNARPIFIDRSATVVSCRKIGEDGQHLQLVLRGKYENYRGVGFGLGNSYTEVQRNRQREIAFTPMINRFRGSVDWQLRITGV